MRRLSVRGIMTSSVISLKESDSLHKASITLAVNGISGAPVVDEKEHLLGMLSSMDILRFIKGYKDRMHLDQPALLLAVPMDDDVEDEDLKRAYREISETKVGEIMTKDIHSVNPDDKLIDALDLMLEKGVRRLPVVEKERVVGIISRKDMVWAIYRDKA
jgi:CBS domain-containing protein